MKNLLLLLFTTLYCFFAYLPVTQALVAIPPKPTTNIYIQDYANILSPRTEQIIQSSSTSIAAKTKAQIVVVTISSLNGASLEDYSLQLFRQWGIGDKSKNNGVLLLIAANDRKSRIEVGYGLEGILPDGLTGRIQDQSMIPFFKQNRYDKGVLNGYANIANYVLKESGLTLKDIKSGAELNSRPVGNSRKAKSKETPWLYKALFLAGFVVLMILDQKFFHGIIFRILLLLLFRGGGRGGGSSGGGGFGGGSGGGGGSSRSW